jgi:hypothetical protein
MKVFIRSLAGPWMPGVSLQIRRTDTTSGCWRASCGSNGKKNDSHGFKARSD